jgi:hypothetical protein
MNQEEQTMSKLQNANSTKQLKKYLFDEIGKLLVISLFKITVGISSTTIMFQLFNDIMYGADLLVTITYSIIFMIILVAPVIIAAISIEKSLKRKLGVITPTLIRLIKQIEKEVVEETEEIMVA